MALWQSRRLHRYEKAATHRQIEEASGYVLGDGNAMALLLERGVQSVKAELAMTEKVLGLIGALGFAADE